MNSRITFSYEDSQIDVEMQTKGQESIHELMEIFGRFCCAIGYHSETVVAGFTEQACGLEENT